MTVLSKAAFLAKYTDAVAGQFPTNTSQAIGSDNLREFADDIADSFSNTLDTPIENTPPDNEGSDTSVPSMYLTGAWKKTVTISSAALLTGNSVPIEIVADPDRGAIIPLKFYIHFDYNSTQYATNTTFRFEINGVAVSSTNSTILPSSTDHYTIMTPVDYDNTGNMFRKGLFLEVQSGNPTAGNSIMYVTVIYTIAEETP